jgi:hypothetical protein
MVPKKLTEQEKTMFEKLSQISSYNPRSWHIIGILL